MNFRSATNQGYLYQPPDNSLISTLCAARVSANAGGWREEGKGVVSVAASILLSDEDDSAVDSHKSVPWGAIKAKCFTGDVVSCGGIASRLMNPREYLCRNYSSAVDKINGRNLGRRWLTVAENGVARECVLAGEARKRTSRLFSRGTTRSRLQRIRSMRNCVRFVHFRREPGSG